MLTKRIIACMDIADGRVKKGTNFKNLHDAGDPVELGKLYSDNGIDELIFLDVMAIVENRNTLLELVSRVAKEINIPFAVGGGVKTIEDIRNLLNAGADKISIGSTSVTDPDFVNKATKEFGSQCIIISVDPKKEGGSWKIYINGGRERTNLDAIEFCKDMEQRGAGELLVNSLDRDGTNEGYDIKLLKAISEVTNLPIIASSGAGKKEDFLKVFKKTDISAALAASLFHYKKLEIKDLKKYLINNEINIRL
ncbi:MAG: imidazole glycerol phosphate synthase subunit HisF [Candidatus Magasanikbacteria bacterium]|jgi:imidazole glycerol-phosphate synthase subunit HisF|nr:imidazole glycerol phosphate synthase subunit HisF [Candidatus Magasanikbacteria bacterium]MBT4314866.1 imidazole glycerol phosphate synthase subunit HisF [Candidatus Magasanikbacteria bacterium]MBT4546747.1 imidazole glycerol phosphate synthase subunit HisF [Candidatus Magasanikbacteria bacterium]MBT6819644.1 imidazole glycerol phosphate synthase subunit HisF [Candidatus Magasanikbacteria bacterium]